MTNDLYPAGLPIHAFAVLSNTDAPFSFFDDQGAAVTFKSGDRIIIDGGLFVQGSSQFGLIIYFDDGNHGSYIGQHTLFQGSQRIYRNTSAFVRGNSQAGANGGSVYAPSVRWQFGAANGATVMVFGRKINT